METLMHFESLAAPATPTVASRLRMALVVLHRANPALSATGWLNVGLAVLAVAGLLLDHRLVTGVPVWLKPLKFALSVTAYAWTLGWLLADLPGAAQRSVRTLSRGVTLSMAVEQGAVFVQAGRGTASHYNMATAFDGLLFALMGLFIFVNTAMTLWALYLVWRYRSHGPSGYVWGVRWGLLVFIAGTLVGGFMIHLNQHTGGAPDGGPGLPGLGWSTSAGDLRVAHFLGVHALQAIPLLGWALSRWVPRRAAGIAGAGALAYAALVAGLLWQALAGGPLVSF